MSKRVFFPQYAKAGSVEILTGYSIGDEHYKVYLVTIDEMNKFVHDEREKGKLEFVTMEEAAKTGNEIGHQIRVLKKQLHELLKTQEQNQYIVSVLREEKSNGVTPANTQQKANPQHHCKGNCQCHSKQVAEPKKNEQTTESFTIKTPLGFVAVIDEEGVGFSPFKGDAKFFKNKEEAIELGKMVFKNQLPFRVEPIDLSKKGERQEGHDTEEEGFITNLLNQIVAQALPSGEPNMEMIKQLFPNAEIKGFGVDKDGNIYEL